MTLLTTPIFDFHKVISALMTPLTIPIPSLVKTSLKRNNLSKQPRGELVFSFKKWEGWVGKNTEDEVAKKRDIRLKGFFILFLFFFLWHVLSREHRNTSEQLGKPVRNYFAKLMNVKDLV